MGCIRPPSSILRVNVPVGHPGRLGLLAGRPGAGIPDKGPTICACFEVGRNQIISAVREHGCTTVAAVGADTFAGTNCGSCRAEIGKLIHEANLAHAG